MRIGEPRDTHDGPSDLSQQERDLGLFLDSLGVKLPAFDPSLPDEYAVVRLDPFAGSLLDANDNKAVLLAFRLRGRAFPLTIVFFRGTVDVLLCHSTLLLDSYQHKTLMVPQLRMAVREFFVGDADRQVGRLEPSWTNAPFKGQLDCRILWNAKPEMKIVTDLFLEKLGEVRELPLFPSVYYYNNPYDQNLLEAALPDLDGCKNVLVLGTGAGLEAVCVALKYRVPVDATDTNPVAIANTIAACRRTGTDHLVQTWVSDGLKHVNKQYDAVLFEAPLATNDTNIKDPNRYDFGGKLLREVLSALPSHLKPGGRMYLMSRPDLSPYFPANGMQWKVLRQFEAKSKVAIHRIWLG
jgi:tRNA1(Val) A37 N6-methylase TrmN6